MSRKRWYILLNPKTKQREHKELNDRQLGEHLAEGWAFVVVTPEKHTTALNTEGLPHKAEVAAATDRVIARNREPLIGLADK